mgnify:CR=1 FL=1
MRKTKDLVTGLAGMGLAIFYLLSAQSIAFFEGTGATALNSRTLPVFWGICLAATQGKNRGSGHICTSGAVCLADEVGRLRAHDDCVSFFADTGADAKGEDTDLVCGGAFSRACRRNLPDLLPAS